MKRVLLIIYIFTTYAYANWTEKKGVFGQSIWKWDGDESVQLVKKMSTLKLRSLDLNKYVAELQQQKNQDLKLFKIKDWKIIEKRQIADGLLYLGEYQAQDKRIFWAEIYKLKQDKIVQCLITSEKNFIDKQIDSGGLFCHK